MKMWGVEEGDDDDGDYGEEEEEWFTIAIRHVLDRHYLEYLVSSSLFDFEIPLME